MRPILLLDIDGVLCPFTNAPNYIWDRKQETWWSPLAQAHLRDLRSSYDYVWASMRGRASNHTAGVLYGLPTLKALSFSQTDFTDQTFKLASIKEFLADHEGRPVAWIDDILYEDAFAWAEERNRAEAPTMLARVNPSVGFQDLHAEQLKDFAAFCSE